MQDNSSHFKKGNIPWSKGKKTGLLPWNKGLSKDTDFRVASYSEKRKNTIIGKPSNAKGKHWKVKDSSNMGQGRYIDGRSGEPKYPSDWTETLRESIRERDKFVCDVCGVHQEELTGWNRKLEVHHIDYSKENCNPENLISLCKSCHMKTNGNRDYWLNYFKNNG